MRMKLSAITVGYMYMYNIIQTIFLLSNLESNYRLMFNLYLQIDYTSQMETQIQY